MKKLLLLLVVVLLPMVASADAVEIDGIYYNLFTLNTGENVAQVTRMPNNPDYYKGNIVIPEIVRYNNMDYSVAYISDAFDSRSNITSLTIPKSVKQIDLGYLAQCDNLVTIVIDSENPIYDSRDNCNAIIKTASNTLITGCKNSFIPDGVTDIAWTAFMGCKGLKSIVIPNSVFNIGTYAFLDCTGLTSLVIGTGVVKISPDTFSGCSGLISVKVEDGNLFYDSREDCNAIIETSKNKLIVGTKNTNIPNSVLSIGESAFNKCTGLTSITIPYNVTTIEKYAFYSCTGLTSLTIPNNVTTIGKFVFQKCTGLTSINLSNNIKNIDDYTFEGCTGLTSITIPNNVTTINESAFEGCSGLRSITFPNNLISIGKSAFSGCNNLKDVYCYANKTPTTSENVFKNSLIQEATLHVPNNLLVDYITTDPWWNFGRIVDISDDENGEEIIDIGNYLCCEVKWNGSQSYTERAEGVYFTRGVDFTINNFSDIDILIYKVEEFFGDTDNGSYLDMDLTKIDAGSDKKITFTLSGYNHMPTVLPWLKIYYRNNGKAFIKDSRVPGTSDIKQESLIKDKSSGSWYNLSGQKLAGQPIKKDLYIIDGKKVLFK